MLYYIICNSSYLKVITLRYTKDNNLSKSGSNWYSVSIVDTDKSEWISVF